MNINKLTKLALIPYLIVLIAVSIMPLGSMSKQIMDVHVIKLRGDYFLHMLVYLPLITLIFLRFQKFKWRMLFFALGIAVGLEYVQKLLPYRSFNINDLVANVAGVILGMVVMLIIRQFVKKD
ncbi:MAG: VanZ family protein [Candidatus Cloacimonadales bacterium]